MKKFTYWKTKITGFILGFLMMLGFNQISFADVVENFDGWSDGSYGTVSTYDHTGVGQWETYNTMCDPLNALTGNAIRFNDDSGMNEYLLFSGLDGNGKDGGIGTISFWYRHWDGDGSTVSFKVQYKQGAGSWTDVGSVVSVVSTTYSLFTQTIDITGDDILVKVISIADDERLLIDDFTITDYSGSAVDNPTSFTATASSQIQIDLSWLQNTDTDPVMIVYNETGAFTDPVDGTTYAVSSSALGGTVIYNESGTSFNHTPLSPGTHYYYKAWSVHGGAGSEEYSSGVTDDATTATGDVTPPNFTGGSPKTANVVANSSDVVVQLDELGTAYFVVVADGATAPNSLQVKDGNDSNGDPAISSGTINVDEVSVDKTGTATGLTENTDYDIYVVAEDDEPTPNLQPSPTNLDVKTQKIAFQDDFEDGTLDKWTTHSVIGDQVWVNDEYSGDKFAKMSGFSSVAHQNEDWLITPSLNFNDYTNCVISFDNAKGYSGDDLQLRISTSYDGVSAPVLAEWTDLSGSVTWSSGSWTWVIASVDLSAYSGENVYLAFVYTSDDVNAATWEVDDVVISGEFSDITAPTVTIDPVDASTDIAVNKIISLTFNEAIRNIDNTEITDANVDGLLVFKKDNSGGEDVTFDAVIDAEKKIITITPAADLDTAQTYYVALNANVVEDAADNAISTVQSSTFTTVTPVITITYPVGGESLYSGDDVTVTWTSQHVDNLKIEVYDPVDAGYFELFSSVDASLGTQDFTIPDDAITNSGYKVKLTDLNDATVLSESGEFTITDTIAPSLQSTIPELSATDVSVTSSLTMSFKYDIIKGTGNIVIKKSADDEVFETIDVTGGQVTIVDDTSVVINPAPDFDYNTQYYVLVANGALKDLSDNNYTGISDNATWNFTTKKQLVAEITVTGEGDATTIEVDGGTLQIYAQVSPTDATDPSVTWSVENGTGEATISGTGLLTATADGTVTAKATANDGSGVVGSLEITISNQIILVTGITVTGESGATTIETAGGTLQMSAAVLPADATDKTVTWSVENGTGEATINATGLLTAVANGTVTAKATANDGSGVEGILEITISNQIVLVTGITVTGEGGATTIETDGGTLQMSAAVLPADATDKTVTWSVENGTGEATINATGLLTAVANGTVTAKATANDGSGVTGSLEITISNQIVLVTGITVTGEGGATTIETDKGTLQMSAAVLPADATDKTVTWSVENGTGAATIDADGLLHAVNNGTVIAKATANDGSAVVGSLEITLSNQVDIVLVTGITVTGEGGATTIETAGGTLQMSAAVLPEDADDKTVTWSVENGTGEATISTTGLLTATANGTVSVIATANDGSGVTGSLEITISNQIVLVTGITVTGEGGATTIETAGGTLQMSAAVLPEDADDKTVTWSVEDGTGEATISTTGLLTATANGTVSVIATANDGSGVTGSLEITISNQIVLVTGITVTGEGGAITIETDKGTLQMSAAVLPADATDKTVTWSVENGTGAATIDADGLLHAVNNGTVTAKATANDGSAVVGSLEITLSNQVDLVLVTDITVTGEGGATTIETDKGTLQMSAAVLPEDADDKTVTWSVDSTEYATIDATGLLTTVANGTVIVTATANDGSGVTGNLEITISNQTGINDISNSVSLSVYPNPNNGVFKIFVSNSKFNSDVNVEIVNILGEVVVRQQFDNVTTDFEKEINISNYPKGLYFVRIQTYGFEKIQKIIVR